MATRNAPTVFIETHGCKLNQADTHELASRFVKSGYRVTHEREGVDMYIVNTCTVTQVADGKARPSLRAARRRQPSATWVVATGCYAQRDSKGLLQIPEVDLVVGNEGNDTLVEAISATRPKAKLVTKVCNLTLININPGHKTRAMLKIQEGCD
jgi:threonylcarbamoyladenosine tRNA methylthiotransferase MtaB